MINKGIKYEQLNREREINRWIEYKYGLQIYRWIDKQQIKHKMKKYLPKTSSNSSKGKLYEQLVR